MKNKNLQGILALAIVTALSFGVIAGSNALTKNSDAAGDGAPGAAADAGEVTEEIDVAGAEGIEKAVKTENGYMVTVKTKGYGGDILMNVCFDQDAKNVTAVEVLENSETENVGARIAEAEFLDQFKGVAAPVYLPGMTVGAADTADDAADAAEEPAALNDGEYVAATTERDENGFIDQVTMTVKDGRITEANWEALLEDGTKKSDMSENGQYTMTEDGPTWAEESKALTDGLVANQSLAFLAVDDTGHTDAVASVSIYVGGFAALAQDCIDQASASKVVYKDGEYIAKTTEADENGFIDQVTMTVKDGRITEANWEAILEDGTKKSDMSENGQYTMTEDGPTWAEESKALTDGLVVNQSLDFLTMDDTGHTDAVASVSIYVGGFAALADDCLKQAAGTGSEEPAEEAAPQDGTQVDGISGATISSTAAVKAINLAFDFIQTVK